MRKSVRPRMLPILGFLLFLSSCSSFNKMAVGASGEVIYTASFELETERNWAIFRDTALANLKLVEGLLYVNSENKELLITAIKGNAGYGFAVPETLHLKFQLSDSEESSELNKAKTMYSKALYYSEKLFLERGLTFKRLFSALRERGLFDRLMDAEFEDEKKDLEAVFFTAQAMGGLINLSRDKMSLVAKLPLVKALFDWVCNKDPDINFGACDIFYGSYEAGRPSMLGGNPAKGKKIFLNAIAKRPENMLLKVAYIQFYLIPMSDEKGYKQQKFYLEKKIREYKKNRFWSMGQKTIDKDRINIYQAIAFERFKIIKKLEGEIF